VESACACRLLLLSEQEINANGCRILVGRGSGVPQLQVSYASPSTALLEPQEGMGLGTAVNHASGSIGHASHPCRLGVVRLAPVAAQRLRNSLQDLDWSGDGRIEEPGLRELGLGHGSNGRVGPHMLAWITSSFAENRKPSLPRLHHASSGLAKFGRGDLQLESQFVNI